MEYPSARVECPSSRVECPCSRVECPSSNGVKNHYIVIDFKIYQYIVIHTENIINIKGYFTRPGYFLFRSARKILFLMFFA